MKKLRDTLQEEENILRSEKQRLKDEEERKRQEEEGKKAKEEERRRAEARAKMEAQKTIPLSIVIIFLLILACGVFGYSVGVFAGVARNGCAPAWGNKERTERVEETANGFAVCGMILGGIVGICNATRRYEEKRY